MFSVLSLDEDMELRQFVDSLMIQSGGKKYE